VLGPPGGAARRGVTRAPVPGRPCRMRAGPGHRGPVGRCATRWPHRRPGVSARAGSLTRWRPASPGPSS
jgi:hypothetical protein